MILTRTMGQRGIENNSIPFEVTPFEKSGKLRPHSGNIEKGGKFRCH